MGNVIQIVISALNKSGPGFASASKGLSDLHKWAARLTPALGALTAAGAGSAAVAMANRWLETADAMGKAASSAGVSVEALSSLSYAAQLSDVSNEKLQTSLAKLAVQMHAAASGTGTAVELFRSLGVTVTDSNGRLLSADKVLLQVADKFQAMGPSAERTAAAVELFGKSGHEMIPMLQQGSDGIQAMQAESDKLGATMTTKGAASAELFNDSITRLEASTRGFVNTVMSQLAPSLASIANQIADAEVKSGNMSRTAVLLANGLKLVAGAFVVGAYQTERMILAFGLMSDLVQGPMAAALNTGTQLLVKWGQTLVQLGELVAAFEADLKALASAMVSLLTRDYVGALAGLSKAYKGVASIAQDSLFTIGQASADSAGIVKKNTGDLVDWLKFKWEKFGTDNVAAYARMIGMIGSLTNPAAMAGAMTNNPGAGEGLNPTKGDGSAWLDKIIGDTYKAEEMLSKFRLDSMTGIDALRAKEVDAYNQKLSDINSLSIYEDQARQLREQAAAEHSQRMKDIDKKEWQAKLGQVSNYTGQFGSMLGSLAQLAAASGKKQFGLTQALRYGEAIMNTASGVSRAFSDFPMPYAAVVAAAVGAAGAAQVATIAAQKAPSYAVGSEFIPATGPAVVHQGERIVQSDINADLTEFLSSGSGGGPTHVTILLDGEVLARAMGNMSRDGRLELSARAIA